MKLHFLLVVGIAAGIAGCAKEDQASPESASEMESAKSAMTEAAAIASEADDWRNSEFLEHMHMHAEKLDELNFALDDDDLDGAMTPAYWLSQHDTVDDLPSDLQPIVYRMREAAGAVEKASDLETARAAAQEISDQCQACHVAVGVTTE